MTLIPLLFAAAQIPAQPRQPVLSFPDPRLDDPASYQGYATKFYRDAAGNTVQIYKEGRSGRVVHLLANADNESVGLTVRGAGGPVEISWGATTAQVAARSGFRTLSHSVTARARHIHLGWFLLGSMRVERDFQYWGKHRAPFGSEQFVLEEITRLFAALERLPQATRRRHLTALNAPTVGDLRQRVHPRVTVRTGTSAWTARAVQFSLDGRDSLTLEIRVDPRVVNAARVGDSVSLQARSPSADSVTFTITIGSSARALTPLTRAEIFTPEFLTFLAASRDTAPLLERQARGVELLVSREKLMAGLPAYATYFGRDMLVSALMMRPIWRDAMSEFAIASVLRKLSPDGQVSHEEAMGGQATREAASEYVALVNRAIGDNGIRPNGDSLLARAFGVLQQNRRTRENYHMVDDEFQFPILAASWLSDPDVTIAHKRAFLRNSTDLGEPRLNRLLRELALVARMTEAYAAEQTATNLVSFAPRDSGRWASSSWRDSGVGYANGRFAMDVNAVYAPHALDAIATIFRVLPTLGLSIDSLSRVVPELGAGTTLGRYARDAAVLRRARDAWWGASRHFVVRLAPDALQRHVAARVAALPVGERDYWTALLSRTGADRDSLSFLALALDADGIPIGVANTDVATRLFLDASRADAERRQPRLTAEAEAVLRDVRLFTRHYPVGLHIEGVGPVVANDAYATPDVWAAFERDRYHGPRVIWGREVNLFLLGAANWATRGASDRALHDELLAAIRQVRGAADASGFQSELWSYELQNGRMVPVRYGTGSDVQLWSTTDLAVAFVLSRLR